MIIDLKKIFVNDGASLDISYSLDMSSLEYMGEFPLKKPVKIEGCVSNMASIVDLDARIVYEFDAGCDRCGKPTAKEYSLAVKKALAPSIEGEDSDTIILVPDMKLDLAELVYSETLLSLPMKHLCNVDCKGICPKCGKDLNFGDCDCPKKEIDPRLAVLADLLN